MEKAINIGELMADASVKEMTFTEFKGFLSVMPDGVMLTVYFGKEEDDGREE